MNSVIFGNLDSFVDLKCVLSSKTIGSSQIKTAYTEVVGSDGRLDFTDYFGFTNYTNRTLLFNFSILYYPEAIYHEFLNAIHGKKLDIILSEESDFKYIGRCSVSDLMIQSGIGTFSVTAECEPWRYKLSETRETIMVPYLGSSTWNLKNLRKQVSPKISVSDHQATIIFNNKTFTVPVGNEQIIPEFILTEGNNEVKVKGDYGSATVEFVYTEGDM